MKLAVSNIAWETVEEPEVFQDLAARGVSGIEVAPTRLWRQWAGADEVSARAAAADLKQAGFAVPALQSLLFGLADAQLFGTQAGRQQLIDHLGMVARLAAGLGAGAMVFGSPRNRDRHELSFSQASDISIDIFRRIGDTCAEAGTCLCIEANPIAYGCNFLTRWTEAAELVERVAHPGIGLHIDVACTQMAGDDPVEAVRECARIMRHFHVSEPQLGDFAAPSIDHARIGRALREAGYAGWVSIEMRRTSTPLVSVRQAVDLVMDSYG